MLDTSGETPSRSPSNEKRIPLCLGGRELLTQNIGRFFLRMPPIYGRTLNQRNGDFTDKWNFSLYPSR